MSNLSDPDYFAKLLKAWPKEWPPLQRLEVHEGAYATSDENGYHYYGGMSLIIEGSSTPHPPMKVTVDPPKPVPAKKPKKRAAPRAKRLKNSAIRKDGVILLKDKERSVEETPEP
jgi:hypothetical protein